MRRRLLAVLGVVVALTFAGMLPAHAADPDGQRITRCGQVITQATAYFARNLVCPTGFSWQVSDDPEDPASQPPPTIRIDLRGHYFRGPGSGTGFSAEGSFGAGGVLLIVSNGQVDRWGTAFSESLGGIVLDTVRVHDNDTAIACGRGGGCTVVNSVLSHNRIGTATVDAGMEIVSSLITRNDTGAATGGLSQLRVTDSWFSYNRAGVYNSDGGDTIVTNSTFVGNHTGFGGQDGTFAQLTGNRFYRNGDGIYVDSAAPPDSLTQLSLKGNSAYDNTRYGFYVPVATDQGGNRAWHNGKPCVGIVCAGQP